MSSLSPVNSDDGPHQIHLYSREVPELPFVESFRGVDRPSTPVDANEQYRKSKWVLTLFITSSVLFTQLAVVSGFDTVSSSILLSLFLAVVFLSIMLASKLSTNHHLQRSLKREAVHIRLKYLDYSSLNDDLEEKTSRFCMCTIQQCSLDFLKLR
ncbi:hypothetical protein NECAME_06174 [Necator americanus]|uniref:Uncharacterized protein n=1 Tax=Necator americanus TaxID=51031 RepID=W2TUT2_NECAM|nr:hypothetical protein NECAME_06174 [Necator americanus]ETN85860.1 hypothetical protein NECAME_06174 [Necator americanus]